MGARSRRGCALEDDANVDRDRDYTIQIETLLNCKPCSLPRDVRCATLKIGGKFCLVMTSRIVCDARSRDFCLGLTCHLFNAFILGCSFTMENLHPLLMFSLSMLESMHDQSCQAD
jgi:hypothetical protein